MTQRRKDAILHSKRVTVLGMGRSGLACAKLLKQYGADVFVSDRAEEEELKSRIKELKKEGIEFGTGQHTFRVIHKKDFIVVSPGILLNIPILNSARKANIPILSEIEVASWFTKSRIIAVTGTNGKTTVTSLIGEILKNAGRKVSVAGNIGLPLSEAVQQANDIIVAEVSSFQLATIEKFRPWISVILNITPDHLDWHQNLKDYIRAKAKIFANQKKDDFLILNADDKECLRLSRKARNKVIFFSQQKKLNEGVFVKGKNIISTLLSARCLLPAACLNLPGPCNLENALAAIGVGLICGVKPEVIRRTLREFRGLEHRLELVKEKNGVRFINDSKATNVGATEAALESFPGPIILIMGGRDKGWGYRRLRKLVRERVKALFVLGEAKDKIKEDLTEVTTIYEAKNLEGAVKGACRVAGCGDWVLLSPACASFDMFANFRQRGKIFKELVKKYAE